MTTSMPASAIAPTPPTGWTGYPPAMPSSPGVARHTSHLKLFVFLGVGLAVAIAAVIGISALATPAVKVYTCPPQCGGPPQGVPQVGLPVFVGADNSFSVQYYPDSPSWKVDRDAAGITDESLVDPGGFLRVFATPAGGRTAQQLVTAMLQQTYPNATQRYQLPNAMVGYQPGYGEVDQVVPQSSDGSYAPESVLVMASVKGDVALVAEALGPYQPWDPDKGPWDGHPSGVDMEVAIDLDALVNTFSWSGDPPR